MVEGLSFLVLLFVAMPLKYALGMPQAVKLVGWAHGVLFVLFGALLLELLLSGRWTFRRCAMAFVLGLVPFGAFVLERMLKRDEPAQTIASST